MTNNNELPDWLIEKVARAICESEGVIADAESSMNVYSWESYIDNAKAALSTLPIMEMIDALERYSRLRTLGDKAQEVLDKINKLRGEG